MNKEARKDGPGRPSTPPKPATRGARVDPGPTLPPLALALCQVCGLSYAVGSRCPRGH